MATAKYLQKRTYYLTLNEEEVEYIKGLVQNTLCGNPEAEPLEVKDMRESIWLALSDAKEAQ